MKSDGARQARTRRRPSQVKRFARVELRNWKNFRDAGTALEHRVILVGPNASGKSNFLDAFRFLRDVASPGGGLREAVESRGGVSAIRCLAARRYPNIRITVEVQIPDSSSSWKYELEFNQDNQRRPVVKGERVWRGSCKLLDRPDGDDKKDSARLTQTHLEQVNVNREYRDLVDFFQSIRYLHIVPHLVREPERGGGRKQDPFGSDFLEQLFATPARTRDARLRRIQQALTVAVPQLTDIEPFRDNRGAPHLKGRYQHWRVQGAWQTEEQFSDGTLRLIGLLWAIMDGSGPLLLEEPELSLHPEIVRFLPQLFARIQKRQLLLSTHSVQLLEDEGIGLNEVLLLRPSPEGTEITPASDVDEVRLLLEGGVSLAEAVIPRTRPQRADQLALFPDA